MTRSIFCICIHHFSALFHHASAWFIEVDRGIIFEDLCLQSDIYLSLSSAGFRVDDHVVTIKQVQQTILHMFFFVWSTGASESWRTFFNMCLLSIVVFHLLWVSSIVVFHLFRFQKCVIHQQCSGWLLSCLCTRDWLACGTCHLYSAWLFDVQLNSFNVIFCLIVVCVHLLHMSRIILVSLKVNMHVLFLLSAFSCDWSQV